VFSETKDDRHEATRARRLEKLTLNRTGDFVQALGPAAAIRRHHSADEITLLTTRPFADLAQQSGPFDKIVIDDGPKFLDIAGWFALRRVLPAAGSWR
jgi:ADP-heptose:LPS heptosyltransferase